MMVPEEDGLLSDDNSAGAVPDSPDQIPTGSAPLNHGNTHFDRLEVELTDGDTHNPPRSLTYLNGLALVIGLQIGSGIFSTPAVVRNNTPSAVVAILVWLLAGVLAWTGAASFIELGTIVPKNGGVQEYLRHCYGDIFGFLFSWTWIVVMKPCGMAMISLVFSEFLCKAFSPDAIVSIWILKAIALLAVVSVTYLNCLGTRVGTTAASFFLVVKVLGLGSIAVLGLVCIFFGFKGPRVSQESHAKRSDWSSNAPSGASAESGLHLWASIGHLTDAVFAASFAYGGWDSISFVVGEMKDPITTLPKVLNGAMVVVITLFFLANLAFYNVVSPEVLQNTNAVAQTFGKELFGQPGAIFYTWIVSISCLGALNSGVFSAGRLTEAAGERHYLPSILKTAARSSSNDIELDERAATGFQALVTPTLFLGRVSKGNEVPVNAMILNGGIGVVFVLVGSFRGLLSVTGMIEYAVFFTTVSGLLVLRTRPQSAASEPSHPIYRTHIWNPVIFCLVSALIAIRGAFMHPLPACMVLLFFAGGALLYRSTYWQQILSGGGGS